jgi:hypothetical protein
MRKLSTQCMNDLKNEMNRDRNEKRKSSPRKETLDFLSQFARVYQVVPAVMPELCGIVVN